MSKIIFVFETDGDKSKLEAMRKLLKEIGGKNYWRAVADCGKIYMEQKPLGVSGHYIEYECDGGAMYLYYRYSGGTHIKILRVNGFWLVPKKGWKMRRKE